MVVWMQIERKKDRKLLKDPQVSASMNDPEGMFKANNKLFILKLMNTMLQSVLPTNFEP
jgi:hypothetical protein